MEEHSATFFSTQYEVGTTHVVDPNYNVKTTRCIRWVRQLHLAHQSCTKRIFEREKVVNRIIARKALYWIASSRYDAQHAGGEGSIPLSAMSTDMGLTQLPTIRSNIFNSGNEVYDQRKDGISEEYGGVFANMAL